MLRLVFIGVVSLFVSCNFISEDDLNITSDIAYNIKIDKDTLTTLPIRLLSDILKGHSLIKLETKKECLIGTINKILVSKDKIYILDNTVTHTLFVFDRYGKFLFKINNKGKGAFEYMEIDDFTINEVTNEIILLDTQKKKMIFYNSRGKAKSEKRIKFYADFIQNLNKDEYVLLGSGYYDRLVIWNANKEKIILKKFKFTEKEAVKTVKPLD